MIDVVPLCEFEVLALDRSHESRVAPPPQFDEMLAQFVGPRVRTLPGKPLARPLLGVAIPAGVAEYRDDLTVPAGAAQVFGQHRDVRVDVA